MSAGHDNRARAFNAAQAKPVFPGQAAQVMSCMFVWSVLKHTGRSPGSHGKVLAGMQDLPVMCAAWAQWHLAEAGGRSPPAPYIVPLFSGQGWLLHAVRDHLRGDAVWTRSAMHPVEALELVQVQKRGWLSAACPAMDRHKAQTNVHALDRWSPVQRQRQSGQKTPVHFSVFATSSRRHSWRNSHSRCG